MKRTFGSIRKLPSGRFQGRYTAPNGVLVTAPKTFAARVHAEAWIGDRLREIDAGIWNAAAVSAERRVRPTFQEYAQEWIETRQVRGRPIKARTRRHYEGLLRRELYPAFGPRELASIAPADIRKWHAKAMLDRPTMRAHAYDLLRTIFTTAWTEELIDANPCRIRGAGNAGAPAPAERDAQPNLVGCAHHRPPPRPRIPCNSLRIAALMSGRLLKQGSATPAPTRRIVLSLIVVSSQCDS